MDAVSAASTLTDTSTPRAGNGFSDLGSDDFLKLLVTQLTNQDPLEPTGNEELLRQISSIREIELSTTLTDSLRRLTGQQNVTAASTMIGQYVTGLPAEDGSMVRGLVVGVRFGDGGKPVLLLASGAQLPLEEVSSIEPPLRAAEGMVGANVVGLDSRDPKKPQIVEGVVSGTRVDEKGEVFLELDTGGDLRLRDVTNMASSTEN